MSYGWLKGLRSKHFGWSIIGGSGAEVNPPNFIVFADGTVTPTRGTAGNFARASEVHVATGPNTVSVVASGTAVEECLPAHFESDQSYTRTGILISSVYRNELDYSNQFDQWTLVGTPTVTANTTTDPASTSTADQLNAADTEGVQVTCDQNATDYPAAWMTFGCWIKAVSGTPTIKLRVKDGASTYWSDESHSDGVTVDSSWQYYEVWGRNPTPGSGQLIGEITASGAANVYLSFASLNFAGMDAGWDTCRIGHVPLYKGNTGANRESTAQTTLNYTGSEITGASQDTYTIMGWFFMPDIYERPDFGNTISLFSAENEAQTVFIRVDSDLTDGDTTIRWGSATPVSYSTIDLRRATLGRWAHYAYVLADGDQRFYLDGVEVISASASVTAFDFDYFCPGQSDRVGVSGAAAKAFPHPMGEMRVWKGKANSEAEVLEQYTDTKESGEHADTESSWAFTTTGAADTALFNAISGNVTTEVEALTATANSTPTYYCQGASGDGDGSALKGTNLAGTAYFEISSLSTAYNVGSSEDFVVCAQWRMDHNNVTAERLIFDCSDYGATAGGFMLIVSSTNWDFYVYDDSSTGHVTRFTHNGVGSDDGRLVTARWVFDRSNTTATLDYKVEGETEVDGASVSQALTAWSSLGAVSCATDNMRFGNRSNGTASPMRGTLYQFAIAVGTTTYDVAKP